MDKAKAALTSLLAGLAVTALKIVAWIQSSSVAVLADATHSAVDLLAVAVTYIAVKASLKPPDEEHPYGHHKAETLGGIGGSLAVMASAALVAYEAFTKLLRWEPYTPTLLGAAVMAVAMAIDLNRVLVLRRFRGVSRALEADALHFSTDLASSATILAALLLGAAAASHAPEAFAIWGPAVDVALGAAITAYFTRLSLSLLKTSVVELLDYAPPDVVARTRQLALGVDGVQSVKSVKVRKSGSVYHADLTITVDENLTVKEAHEIADQVEKTLRKELGGEVVIHVEPQKTTEETPSAASRSPQEPSGPPSRSPR
ncbi:cation diffusion facilitator family transporter [Pyrobaculum neutrophilum]|uniref:Cation diffusion facilitator family transporter n=1 Tax=Pyrobaculum neutrophilum (strain DSM 2338 / JCM 9278 / NBRC 100436 / V24Sta) TaxID=444157 RepID=B1YBK4_PYRNV|nr:cation diffusion facilitator family transporter [Pyrobaculum neutrophilum]ACB40806.1 cation diffusion facilitator family transporter [Pyrobaculum neutrophilum V24Sta]